MFSQIIPSEFVGWVTDELFPVGWADNFDESEGNTLQDFIEAEIGSVDPVMDPVVRTHLKRLIEAYSSNDPKE